MSPQASQHKQAQKVLLSIDPGYDRVGWAIGLTEKRNYQLVEAGYIQTDSNNSTFYRYQQIQAELEKLCLKHKPDEAAIESLFFSVNRKSAIQVSEARGLIIGVLLAHNLPIFEYHPVKIKEAVTGYGKADKKAVEKMVKMQTSLSNDATIIDDAIDAIALGITHALNASGF